MVVLMTPAFLALT